MTIPLSYCLLMTIKGAHIYFKYFSLGSTMRPLQIIADPLKTREQIQVLHPIGLFNPELNEEIEEEVGDTLHYPMPDKIRGRR